MNNNNERKNAEMLQSVISDNLFPEVTHISDVKQVLETMELKGQELQEEQVKALILLDEMSRNEFLHGKTDPYRRIINNLLKEYKIGVVSPSLYLNTIEELIPKPPKPVVLTGDGKVVTPKNGG